MKRIALIFIAANLLLIGAAGFTLAEEDGLNVTSGVDFYNRYVWRGLDIAGTPSIQPTLALDYRGFEFGTWGAYTLSNEASESDEIDFWLSYSKGFEGGSSFSLMIIDYYFPNAGVDFFNFNNYDATNGDGSPDPGAHTLEAGISFTGPSRFPVTVSAFVNFHNDEGNNTYFQVDYPFTVNETSMNLFCGFTGGSEENPGYYGTDNLQAINVGLTAAKEIKMSDSFSLPLSVSFILNPNEEISHILVGVSL